MITIEFDNGGGWNLTNDGITSVRCADGCLTLNQALSLNLHTGALNNTDTVRKFIVHGTVKNTRIDVRLNANGSCDLMDIFERPGNRHFIQLVRQGLTLKITVAETEQPAGVEDWFDKSVG